MPRLKKKPPARFVTKKEMTPEWVADSLSRLVNNSQRFLDAHKKCSKDMRRVALEQAYHIFRGDIEWMVKLLREETHILAKEE